VENLTCWKDCMEPGEKKKMPYSSSKGCHCPAPGMQGCFHQLSHCWVFPLSHVTESWGRGRYLLKHIGNKIVELQSSSDWKGPLQIIQSTILHKTGLTSKLDWGSAPPSLEITQGQQFHTSLGTCSRVIWVLPHISIRISLLQQKATMHLWEERSSFSL